MTLLLTDVPDAGSLPQVRQNYIRRRLQITFRALNRLSQSEFNLEQLFSGGVLPSLSGGTGDRGETAAPASRPADPPPPAAAAQEPPPPPEQQARPAAAQQGVTFRDVDRQRGRPLTRYQRNMMVFNWLHTLDDTGLEVT